MCAGKKCAYGYKIKCLYIYIYIMQEAARKLQKARADARREAHSMQVRFADRAHSESGLWAPTGKAMQRRYQTHHLDPRSVEERATPKWTRKQLKDPRISQDYMKSQIARREAFRAGAYKFQRDRETMELVNKLLVLEPPDDLLRAAEHLRLGSWEEYLIYWAERGYTGRSKLKEIYKRLGGEDDSSCCGFFGGGKRSRKLRKRSMRHKKPKEKKKRRKTCMQRRRSTKKCKKKKKRKGKPGK
jgi:hypothetical protein